MVAATMDHVATTPRLPPPHPREDHGTRPHPVQQDLLVGAWAASQDGNGLVIEPWAYPDAEELVEQGWLEQRVEDATGEPCWFWTRRADLALNISDLMHSHEGRDN